MLSINTNLSSQIVQSSLKQSTNSLNTAIERMTTGAKINHAKDNAANYSIATNMSSKISAYQVAEDNCTMGLDLVTTASDIIATMQDHATRLQSLSIQARNGTYGASSLSAITSEASAIMAEITRLYTTAEYNNVSILNRSEVVIDSRFVDLTPKYNGFIDNPVTYTDTEVAAMTTLESVDETTAISSGTYSISTADELAKLATMTNNGLIGSNTEFVLANDIDLSADYWTPIGNSSSNAFKGTFDGNGHAVKNIIIEEPLLITCGGLFAYLGGSAKNVSIQDCYLWTYEYTGGLAGILKSGGEITNCYATGTIAGEFNMGGLVGYSYGTISDCYSEVDLNVESGGGLVGVVTAGTITNCYAAGNLNGNSVGGLVNASFDSSLITNCYTTGNVSGSEIAGGLIGSACYGTTISNCYTTGNVSGNEWVGGLVGEVSSSGSSTETITNCTSYSNVLGNDTDTTGSFIGVFSFEGFGPLGTVIIGDCKAMKLNMNSIGKAYELDMDYGSFDLIPDYDMTDKLAGISEVVSTPSSTTLQIGINSNDSCQLSFNTNFMFDISAITADIASDAALNQITDFMNLLSEKQTQLGSVQNRLESALDQISVSYENLVSSLSTIQDADIGEVSSEYIRQQILQQASATLMATANQSPSIALQLL